MDEMSDASGRHPQSLMALLPKRREDRGFFADNRFGLDPAELGVEAQPTQRVGAKRHVGAEGRLLLRQWAFDVAEVATNPAASTLRPFRVFRPWTASTVGAAQWTFRNVSASSSKLTPNTPAAYSAVCRINAGSFGLPRWGTGVR